MEGVSTLAWKLEEQRGSLQEEGWRKWAAAPFGRICKYTEEYSFAANTGGYEIAERRLTDRGGLAGGLLAAGEPGGCRAEGKTGTEPFLPN